jgi:TolB-like protein/DNA-binding winged helix-turn-helix (wHTH) protein/Flp pilus assembly protein TadD
MTTSGKKDIDQDRQWLDSPFLLGEFEINPKNLRIDGPDRGAKVEFKVMQVLLMLASEPQQVISRRTLESTVWSGRIVSEDAVTNAVAKLRRAFGDNARAPRFIETVSKQGYRLMLEPRSPTRNPSVTQEPERRWRVLVGGALAVAVLVGVLIGRALQPPAPQAGAAAQPATADTAVLAVLPFSNRTGDPGQRPVAEGLAQELIADLSLQPDFTVLSAKTTFHLDPDAPELNRSIRELGARYAVLGDLTRHNTHVHIDMRLLETASGDTLWSTTLHASEQALFDLQRRVASAIAAAIGANGDFEFVDRRGTTDSLAAYDEFLRGRTAYVRLTPEDNAIARAHFSRATELDPEFARAYAGLALTWAREVMDGWSSDPDEALAEAANYAATAEALDPEVPQIHFTKGLIALFQGQHLAAAEAAQHATVLDPNFADAFALLAWILHYGGRPEVAVEVMHEALRLNPLSSASYASVLGEINFALGRYEDAVSCFREALERNAAHARARLWLAASLAQTGQLDDARWELDELLAAAPGIAIDELAFGLPFKDPKLPERLSNALARVGMAD